MTNPEAGKKTFFPKVPVLDLAENKEMLIEFVAEAIKHLLTAKNSILMLESMVYDREAIDSLFKSFHTIKGLADFLNLDDIRCLTEETEILMNLVRRNILKFDTKISNVVSQAIDGLHKLIELLNEQIVNQGELKSPYYDVSALIKSIRSITEKVSPESLGSPFEFEREIPTISLEEHLRRVDREEAQRATSPGVISSVDYQKVLRDLEETRQELQQAQGKLAERQRELIRERQLSIKLTQQAQAIARAKSEYLATMAHEIRTLINAILGFADLVKKGELTPKQSDHLETISLSGKLLLGIVNDILDFSKVEAGKLKLESIPFDLTYIIEEVFKIIRTRLNSKPVNIYYDIPDNVPRFLVGDPTRLKQIFINLLDNSIKFTEKGEIGLTISGESVIPREKGKDMQKLKFLVEDTGIGIPENRRSSIFDSFTQADNSITRIYGGSGLGLSLCKNYIETMGGRIWVESEIGKGSKFTFEIAFEVSSGDSKVASPTLPKELRGQKVILIDRSVKSRETFKNMCQRLNLQMLASFEQTKDVVDFLFTRKETKSTLPNIIFIDMMFPENAASALISRIRYEERLKEIKLFAVSSDFQVDISKMEVDNLLPKPFIDSEVVRLLEQVYGLKVEEQPISQGLVQKFSCEGIKVLVVEDSLPNQELLKAHFESLGCVVDYANNGQEAIDKIKNKSYDICFMDLQMPVMGGLEAVGVVRQQLKKDLPIVALTAAALEEEKQKCLASGMNEYLAKPFNFFELKEKIIRCTKR